MKRMWRKHRSYFRICATDSRAPRDGRVIEELGSYDPSIPLTDGRCQLNNDRIQYWLGVGAKPSDRVKVLIKKYGPSGTHLKEQEAAVAQLKAPKVVPEDRKSVVQGRWRVPRYRRVEYKRRAK